jgi:hypothetical protein
MVEKLKKLRIGQKYPFHQPKKYKMVWTDTIHSCQNMQDQILNFQNTFDSACDEIILEIQSRKFLLKSNYINSTLYQNAVF